MKKLILLFLALFFFIPFVLLAAAAKSGGFDVWEMLQSDYAMAFYGAAFWYVFGMFFPGVNPILKRIIVSIAESNASNEQIKDTAVNLANQSGKAVLKKLAARYLIKKLPG